MVTGDRKGLVGFEVAGVPWGCPIRGGFGQKIKASKCFETWWVLEGWFLASTLTGISLVSFWPSVLTFSVLRRFVGASQVSAIQSLTATTTVGCITASQ